MMLMQELGGRPVTQILYNIQPRRRHSSLQFFVPGNGRQRGVVAYKEDNIVGRGILHGRERDKARGRRTKGGTWEWSGEIHNEDG